MKKLIVLLLMIVSKLTAFSQTDTDTIQSVKCFPIPVVRQIIKDLIIGDSAKTELTLTNSQLTLTREQLIKQDSVISKYMDKESDYKKVIDFERRKYAMLEEYTKTVEDNFNKVQKKYYTVKYISKVKTYVIGAGILTGIGAWIYYFKFR